VRPSIGSVVKVNLCNQPWVLAILALLPFYIMETLNNGPFIRYLETTRSIGSFPHTQKKIWGECLLFRALTILWDQIWTGKNCDDMEFSRALTDTAVWTGKMFGVKFDSFLNNMLQCSTSCTTHVIAGWLCKASSQFSQDSSWNHAWLPPALEGVLYSGCCSPRAIAMRRKLFVLYEFFVVFLDGLSDAHDVLLLR
jgi:hypothetical protein